MGDEKRLAKTFGSTPNKDLTRDDYIINISCGYTLENPSLLATAILY